MPTPSPRTDVASWGTPIPAYWLRWGIAFVWLWTGLAVLHPYYRELGTSYLKPLGLPPLVMYVTCAAEVLLGLRVALGRAATWLTLLQVVLITGFTAILSVSQPDLWLHPLGMLTKNLALLVMIGAAWLLEREGGSERAYRLLLGGMAVFWFADGLLSLFARDDRGADGLVLRLARFLGRCELATAVAVVVSLVAWKPVPRIVLYFLLVVQLIVTWFVTLYAINDDELAWFHPFGPLTKNVPIVIATLMVGRYCSEQGMTVWPRSLR